MAIEIVTKEDLENLRQQLIHDIRIILAPPEKMVKPWLRNAEVRQLLSISSNTVQRLRIAGKLRSVKVGGIHYYRYEDIEKMMNSDEDAKM